MPLDILHEFRVGWRMRPLIFIAFAALVSPIATAALPSPSDTRIGNTAGWFICDGVDAPYVALVAKPSNGAVRIGLLHKARPDAAPAFAPYRLGRPDPGAGQVYWPLLRDGQAAGYLHAFNTGALAAGLLAKTPPFTSVRLGRLDMQCRWRADTIFFGIGKRRSILVRQISPGRLTYESFDYAKPASLEAPDGVQRTTRPTQRVIGGQVSPTARSTTFRFPNDGYVYAITVTPGGPAALTVEKGGRVVQTERLIAYTLAERGQ